MCFKYFPIKKKIIAGGFLKKSIFNLKKSKIPDININDSKYEKNVKKREELLAEITMNNLIWFSSKIYVLFLDVNILFSQL